MYLKLFLLLGIFYSEAHAFQSPAKPVNQEKASPIIIKLQMEGMGKVVLNYTDDNNQPEKVEIKNPTVNDTLMRFTVQLKRPTHFYNTATTGSPQAQYHFLLLPGDTLVLQQEKSKLHFRSYTQGRLQLNQLFWILTGTEKELQPTSAYASRTVAEAHNILKRIQDSTAKSNNIIDSLYRMRLIHPGYYFALRQFSLLNHFNSIYLFSRVYPDLNRTHRQMFRHLQQMNTIGSKMNSNVITMVTLQHAATVQGKTQDMWKCLSLLPDTMKAKKHINEFAFYYLKNSSDARNKKMLETRITQLQKSGFQDDIFPNFYKQFVRNENLGRITTAALVSPAGDTANLRSLLQSLPGQYVLLEFWTSQTDSGRLLHQQWLASQAKMKNAPVTYVSICLDGDDQHDSWVAAAGSTKEALQYRVKSNAKAVFLRSYRFANTSRYLLYNGDLELVTAEFKRPDHKDFEAELLARIKK